SATAAAVLPTPVGPTSTGVRGRGSGPPKPALQLLLRQLHQARPAMDVVRRERGGEEADDQLAHFVRVQAVAGLDGGAAGVRRGKALQAVLPSAEPPPREVGDELLEAAGRLEAGLGAGGWGLGVRARRARAARRSHSTLPQSPAPSPQALGVRRP